MQDHLILETLKEIITKEDKRLLELWSGEGESALSLASHFPWLEWYPTESSAKLGNLKVKLQDQRLPSIQKPQRLEIGKDELPKLKFEIIFTSNTFHQMHWKECKSLMKMLGGRLREGARAIIYGPFKYDGEFLSAAHAELDQALKAKDPLTGVRSFEDVNNVMVKNGFEISLDEAMSDGNRLLVFTRLKHR